MGTGYKVVQSPHSTGGKDRKGRCSLRKGGKQRKTETDRR